MGPAQAPEGEPGEDVAVRHPAEASLPAVPPPREPGSAHGGPRPPLTHLHRPERQQQVQLPLPHHQRQEDGGFGQRQVGESVSDIELPQAEPGFLFYALSRSKQRGAP